MLSGMENQAPKQEEPIIRGQDFLGEDNVEGKTSFKKFFSGYLKKQLSKGIFFFLIRYFAFKTNFCF